jgi:mono/diheme cytochrome c family protein
MLIALAAILAVGVVLVLKEWSADPNAPGSLLTKIVGGPTLSVGTPADGTATPGSVPRPRTGLVATSQNRGQVLFGRYCDSCHTAGREMIGPSLRTAQFKDEFNTESKIAEVVRSGGFEMPAYPPTLVTDEELQKIAEYVLSLPGDKP